MKNNLDFYRHYADAHQHPKFKMLRLEYGWEGEGKFWALNNIIAKSENCMLDLSKKYNKSTICMDLDFKKGDFDKFVNFLIDDCQLLRKSENGFITNDILQANFGVRMEEREKARERMKKYRGSSGEHRECSGEQLKSSGEKTSIGEGEGEGEGKLLQKEKGKEKEGEFEGEEEPIDDPLGFDGFFG